MTEMLTRVVDRIANSPLDPGENEIAALFSCGDWRRKMASKYADSAGREMARAAAAWMELANCGRPLSALDSAARAASDAETHAGLATKAASDADAEAAYRCMLAATEAADRAEEELGAAVPERQLCGKLEAAFTARMAAAVLPCRL